MAETIGPTVTVAGGLPFEQSVAGKPFALCATLGNRFAALPARS
jgi:hypothetical protein